MHIELALAQCFGKRHLAQRLTRPRPNLSQRAESRSEIDTHLGLSAVESRHIHRRQAGLEAFYIQTRFGFRATGTRRDLRLGV